LSKLPSYLTEKSYSFTTVDGTQYYDYPPNMRDIESITVVVGSVTYTLKPIHSYKKWTEMNAITIQAGALPTHYFKRESDFGIYPIPQDAYTVAMIYNVRGGGLVRTDYITGTVTTVNADETATGSGTTWNSTATVRPGDWFVQTDANAEPVGNWYEIDSITDATHLELKRTWNDTAIAASTYKIGQTPFGPPEGHELRAWGALADYFAGFKQSQSKAQGWNNMFWTGDYSNTSRMRDPDKVTGGLIGLIMDYENRDDSQLIDRNPGREDSADLKKWGITLS